MMALDPGRCPKNIADGFSLNKALFKSSGDLHECAFLLETALFKFSGELRERPFFRTIDKSLYSRNPFGLRVLFELNQLRGRGKGLHAEPLHGDGLFFITSSGPVGGISKFFGRRPIGDL